VLTFSPNPASDVATVRYTLESTGQQATFVLLDVYGRQVLRQRLPADVLSGELTLNLSDLPSGTYIGAITVEGQRQAISRLTIVK
jgi:hypothetical protein